MKANYGRKAFSWMSNETLKQLRDMTNDELLSFIGYLQKHVMPELQKELDKRKLN